MVEFHQLCLLPPPPPFQMYDIVSGSLMHTLGGGHFETINCCRRER